VSDGRGRRGSGRGGSESVPDGVPERLARRSPLHPPPMERVGNEPATARSPLRLRLVLALFGAVSCAAGVAGSLWLAAADDRHQLRWTLAAVVFAAASVAALLDAVVIVNRLRDERRPMR